MKPTEFAKNTDFSSFNDPYITQMKLFDTIEEYGKNGIVPVVLLREIWRIVGSGAREQRIPVNGATVLHAPTADFQFTEDVCKRFVLEVIVISLAFAKPQMTASRETIEAFGFIIMRRNNGI